MPYLGDDPSYDDGTVFRMDGVEHKRGLECCRWGYCGKCHGVLHVQGTALGLMRLCEKCHLEEDDDE